MSGSGESHAQPNYVHIFGALIVLTMITVGVSRIELGHTGNAILAMGVAVAKGLLVAMYFMHLKFETKHFIMVIAIPPLVFLVAYLLGIYPDIGFVGRL